MKVLVVDDNAEFAEFVRTVALEIGHDVEVCANGSLAKDTYHSFAPEVIVLDMVMPEIDGIEWIDDSKATNVAAAVASIASIDDTIVLIAGGDGKGSDFADLAAALEGKLRAAVLIGKDAEAIAEALDTVMPVYFAQDMVDAVRQAAACAESDDTVLLAPACASLDQYANYGERGDAFREAVEALTK